MTSWVSLALLLALAIQVLLVAIFAWQVRRRRLEQLTWEEVPKGGWPSAEVVLCLRGADQSLKTMLESIANQQYPGEWRLQVVIDSIHDPSWKIIERFIDDRASHECFKPTWTDLHLHSLSERPARGSLKCASLLQAFDNLNDESAVVALVDADAVVHPQWLSQLVQACSQPKVGAVSGNRWFVPERDTLMGWTRAVWNAGALVLMTLFGIPWGGSLAVRREVIEAGAWKASLKHGFCEDTGLIEPLRQLGLRYVFRPELLVVDRDDGIELSELSSWISRQLLTARLHHAAWPWVALHGIGTTSLVILGVIQQTWISLIIYELGCICLLVWIEAIAQQRPPRSLWGWGRALLLGQLVDGWATLATVFKKKVEWSNVEYQVTDRPRGVALVDSPRRMGEGFSSAVRSPRAIGEE